MKELDATTMRLVSTRMNELLQALGDELDVNLFVGNGSYTSEKGTFKVGISPKVPLDSPTSSGDFPIGSIWFKNGNYYRCMENSRRSSRYPLEFLDLKTNRLLRTTKEYFLSVATRISTPDTAAFTLYLSHTYEDDTLTSEQVAIWDSVDAYLDFRYESKDEFKKFCTLLDKIPASAILPFANSLYHSLVEALDLKTAYELIKHVYKNGKDRK